MRHRRCITRTRPECRVFVARRPAKADNACHLPGNAENAGEIPDHHRRITPVCIPRHKPRIIPRHGETPTIGSDCAANGIDMAAFGLYRAANGTKATYKQGQPMNAIRELVALAKDQGVIIAGWVLLFGAVAWIAGQGARAAVRNVESMLRMNEKLREQLAKQLVESNKARGDAERQNSQLRVALDSAQRRMDELEGRLLFAERRSRTLESELAATIVENRRLRATLNGEPPLTAIGEPST